MLNQANQCAANIIQQIFKYTKCQISTAFYGISNYTSGALSLYSYHWQHNGQFCKVLHSVDFDKDICESYYEP